MSKSVFNAKDYTSNDGMLTSVWGPSLWHVLHTMSFNYPVKPSTDQKKYYYDFFINLKNILPCKYCRDNYTKNLEVLPLTKKVLKNRDLFSRWVYNIHELTNTNLGKKSGLTYEEVRDRYEHFRSRCLINPKEKKLKKVNVEKGCTEPLYGINSKCILNVVPKESKVDTFKIDKKCIFTK